MRAGGFQKYPDDYDVMAGLAKDKLMTLMVAYNLFTQNPKGEAEDFAQWTKSLEVGQGDSFYKNNGGGESSRRLDGPRCNIR